ncbi:MAG: SDR family NAD(P)-dependent oxidoreductase [Rhodospirillales bacterium]|nr:SDR family NAD(P)-dependent oxidoreductase [Rhodospirillales bacterium]
MSEGPVAIVTAAGRGIGAGIARELRAQGWRLALMSPSDNSEKLAKAIGCIGLAGSVTETADLESLVNSEVDCGSVRCLGQLHRLPQILYGTGWPQ